MSQGRWEFYLNRGIGQFTNDFRCTHVENKIWEIKLIMDKRQNRTPGTPRWYKKNEFGLPILILVKFFQWAGNGNKLLQ